MKKILAVMLSLFVSGIVNAENIDIVQPVVPIEDKVVELHITFAPPPTAEVKKARKLMMKTKTGKAICSGSFISPAGHILTARHCVQDSTEIEVVASDGQEYKADILAISKNQDLAIIQIGRTSTPFFELADRVYKGEGVFILGSPLGLTGLVTNGYIAKLAGDILFLDCTALPGNSGGPVINGRGELAGVVSAMIVVILGPARVSVVQSVDSVKFFFYEMMTGKYNAKR